MHAGRLEVFHDGQWGTVCDDNFSTNEAKVVCNMIGFSQGAAFCCNYFGGGTGPIWLDDVACEGNEVDIADCVHLEWGSGNCGDHTSDVAVQCSGDVMPPCASAQDECRSNVPDVDYALHIESDIELTTGGQQQLVFKCVLDPFPATQVTYDLRWEVDGRHLAAADATTVGNVGVIGTLQQDAWVNQYELDFDVVCKVSSNVATLESPPLSAGFVLHPSTIEVNDSETVNVYFQFTVPFPCPSGSLNDPCVQKFTLSLESDQDEIQCPAGTNNQDYQPFTFPQSIEISSNQWNESHSFCVTGTFEPTRGEKRGRIIATPIPMEGRTKRQTGSGPTPSITSTSVTKKSCRMDTSKGVCYSSNDPHMRTFDQRYYELHGNPGWYVMYANMNKCYIVIAKYDYLSNAAGWIMINRGVAIGTGSQYIAYDYTTIGQPLVRSEKTLTSGCGTDTLVESIDSTGKQNVRFPTGTLVRFDNNLNRIEIVPSCSDVGHSNGLCGTYNGNPIDDFMKFGGGHDRNLTNCIPHFGGSICPTDFTDSWKIAPTNAVLDALFAMARAMFPTCSCKKRRDTTATCAEPMHTSKCLFNRNRQGQGRKRRNAHTSGSSSDAVQTPAWTNGWNLDNAREYCEQTMNTSSTSKACATILQGTPYQEWNTDMCILDIFLTGGIDYVDVALNAMGNACQDEAMAEPQLWVEVEEVTTAVVVDYDCSQDDSCITSRPLPVNVTLPEKPTYTTPATTKPTSKRSSTEGTSTEGTSTAANDAATMTLLIILVYAVCKL